MLKCSRCDKKLTSHDPLPKKMKKLKLNKNKIVLVDDEDYEHLNQWSWFYTSTGYAARGITIKGKPIRIYLHRVVAKTPKGKVTDHIDGNKLDNRKINLRVCTAKENFRNRNKSTKARTSKYHGVCFSSNAGKWVANISLKGERHHLGHFDTERHAALAYDLWAQDDPFIRKNITV